MKEFTEEEYFTIAENMKKYGGSFIKALAECIWCADLGNKKRLANAFPEYFNQYLNF